MLPALHSDMGGLCTVSVGRCNRSYLRPRITFSTPPLQAEVRKGPQGEAGPDSGLQQPVPAAGAATASATGSATGGATGTDASEVSLVITRCKYYEMLTRCVRVWMEV